MSKVIVTATRAQLWGMGIISGQTFERLLSGVPIKVDHECEDKEWTMVFLHPEGHATAPYLWVYKHCTIPYDDSNDWIPDWLQGMDELHGIY